MPELLTQLPCTAFIQALASRDPVPGGGGAGLRVGPGAAVPGRRPGGGGPEGCAAGRGAEGVSDGQV